jgi:hypothetical protein
MTHTFPREHAMRRPIFFFAAAAISLAACATDPAQRDAEKLALYEAHAGAPVAKFRYFGSINGWTPLGDEAIAVWTRPSEAYLLRLSGPCPEIEFTPAISITSRFGEVSVPFDKVIVHSRGAVTVPCHITQIRPLDVKAIRQAERTNREAAQASGT